MDHGPRIVAWAWHHTGKSTHLESDPSLLSACLTTGCTGRLHYFGRSCSAGASDVTSASTVLRRTSSQVPLALGLWRFHANDYDLLPEKWYYHSTVCPCCRSVCLLKSSVKLPRGMLSSSIKECKPCRSDATNHDDVDRATVASKTTRCSCCSDIRLAHGRRPRGDSPRLLLLVQNCSRAVSLLLPPCVPHTLLCAGPTASFYFAPPLLPPKPRLFPVVPSAASPKYQLCPSDQP